MPVRVVVVDGSLAQRRALTEALEAGGGIAVVAAAGSAGEAERAVTGATADVVVVDLDLPATPDGRPGVVAAVAAVMAARAVPILLLGSRPAREDGAAGAALAAGAVDCLRRELPWTPDATATLRRRVAVLARLQMAGRAHTAEPAARGDPGAGAVLAIAASTGGPSTLGTVLAALPGLPAPILLVQHIHAEFAASFTAWLQEASGLPVALAVHGERVRDGHVHVAPPGVHLRLGPAGTIALDPEPELLSRPSGDELLRSVAEHAGPRGVGAVLTGMGDDGARGLLALHDRGGITFAQDGASATVDGMPRAARELGAVQRSLPPSELGPALAHAVRQAAQR